MIMRPQKTVGIKELKNNLSAYLREVRGGATLLVTDRNDIVAELHEPYGRTNIAGAVNPLLSAWVQERVVALPAAGKQPLELSPVRLPQGTADDLLNRDRKESGA